MSTTVYNKHLLIKIEFPMVVFLWLLMSLRIVCNWHKSENSDMEKVCEAQEILHKVEAI